MSIIGCGGPNPGEIFASPLPRADPGEEVYALVDEEWVPVKVRYRRTEWIWLSFTYRYDVVHGEKQLLNVPQSDIMTVEDYKERFPNSTGAESGKSGQLKRSIASAPAQETRDK